MAHAKVTRQRVEPEVIEPESQDLAVVKSSGATVMGFLQPAALIQFFKRAGELERHAESLLSRAKAIQAPTSGEEDATVVRQMQAVKLAKAEAVEHWSARGVFFQLHKRLIAAEQRTTAMEDDAIERLQWLHNTWTAEAKRQAQIAADVARREAELTARMARVAELERLEAEALKAEDASEGLSQRQITFCDLVALGLSPEKAAAQAGYANAWKSAASLMSMPKVLDFIKAKQDALAIRRQAEAVKEQPLAVNIERVEADVVKVRPDRETWTGEIYDEVAFIDAFRAGTYGIPWNCITFNQKGCTELARSLKTLANIPGFRAVKKTTTI